VEVCAKGESIPLAVRRVAARSSEQRADPRATLESWAAAYQRRTGSWPTEELGPIGEAPAETWKMVHRAPVNGRRGLPGGVSLFRLVHRPAAER
jgi:hypothetical protein